MRRSVILALGLAVPVAASAAVPSALQKVAGGLWEISGAPGAQAPVRQCVTDVLALAEYEHRGKPCSRSVIHDGPSSTKLNYQCGPAGFGESEVDVITPRSLRIATQGISDQLPFSYVLQARRVGDCTKTASPPRH